MRIGDIPSQQPLIKPQLQTGTAKACHPRGQQAGLEGGIERASKGDSRSYVGGSERAASVGIEAIRRAGGLRLGLASH